MKTKVDQTKKEFIITVSVGSLEVKEIHAILDYAHYKELTSQIRKLDQKEIDKFFSDVRKARRSKKPAKASYQ